MTGLLVTGLVMGAYLLGVVVMYWSHPDRTRIAHLERWVGRSVSIQIGERRIVVGFSVRAALDEAHREELRSLLTGAPPCR